MKKVFIISLVLLFITLFFLGVYNFAFKKDSSKTAAQPEAQNSNAKPSSAASNAESEKNQGKITLVSKEGAVGPSMDKKTEKIKYYSAVNGTLWQTDADGKDRAQIDETEVSGIKSASWSTDGVKTLTTVLGKDGKDAFYEYDHDKNAGVRLKDGLDTAVWDNIGGKIIYKYYDAQTKKRSLDIANPDGSGWQVLVEDLPQRNLSIAQVPLASLVSFWNFPDANEETQLNTVPITGGANSIVFKGRFGADYLWSPDGSVALISSLAGQKSGNISLGTVDLKGAYHDLGIPTLVSKCVWSKDGKTVYYSLPGKIPDGAVMPNDYINKKFVTEDTFWKVDVSTGQKERIIELSDLAGSYDASNLFLSPTEDALFFVNRTDGKIYRLKL